MRSPGDAAAKNGVVITTEKKLPSVLVDEDSIQRIAAVTDSIGASQRTQRTLPPRPRAPAAQAHRGRHDLRRHGP